LIFPLSKELTPDVEIRRSSTLYHLLLGAKLPNSSIIFKKHKEEQQMKSLKWFVSVATVCLLLGASGAMARVVDAWILVGADSASGTDYVEGTDLCMIAFQKLTQENGFRFRGSTQIETRITALVFTRGGETPDVATLFCLANITEEQSDLLGQ
jgi:hypothetical protein